HRLDLGRGLVEVARELDLGVSSRRDAGEGALDVLFHQGAHRVQLDADLREARDRSGWFASRKHRAYGDSAHRPDEFATVDHNSLRFIASTANAAARAVRAM